MHVLSLRVSWSQTASLPSYGTWKIGEHKSARYHPEFWVYSLIKYTEIQLDGSQRFAIVLNPTNKGLPNFALGFGVRLGTPHPTRNSFSHLKRRNGLTTSLVPLILLQTALIARAILPSCLMKKRGRSLMISRTSSREGKIKLGLTRGRGYLNIRTRLMLLLHGSSDYLMEISRWYFTVNVTRWHVNLMLVEFSSRKFAIILCSWLGVRVFSLWVKKIDNGLYRQVCPVVQGSCALVHL